MEKRRCLTRSGWVTLGGALGLLVVIDAAMAGGVVERPECLLAQAEVSDGSGPEKEAGVEGAAPVLGAVPLVAESRPDRYAIQSGDTLWGISRRFWGDPFFWPKLWSFNPYIGNAHLIYPGNILKLDHGSYVRPPSIELEVPEVGGIEEVVQAAQPHGEETVSQSSVGGEQTVCAPHIAFHEKTGSVRVRSVGFLREQGFSPLGRVDKAPEPKLMLSSTDLVYLRFARMDEVECGQVYTIYQLARKRVSHPIYRRRTMGGLYRILGEVRIVDANEFLATAEIVEAYGEIRRGDLVTEVIPIYRDVEIRASSREIDGYIVQAINLESNTISTNNVVYIDRGEQDGVMVGDAFYVLRQGDGIEGLVSKGKRDITLPYQIVGRLIVSEPGEYVSAAIVTEATMVLEVGDHIATQVN